MVGMDGVQAGRTGGRAARAEEIIYAKAERRGGNFSLYLLAVLAGTQSGKKCLHQATSVHSLAVWVVRRIVFTIHAAVAGTFWALTGSKGVCDFNS